MNPSLGKNVWVEHERSYLRDAQPSGCVSGLMSCSQTSIFGSVRWTGGDTDSQPELQAACFSWQFMTTVSGTPAWASIPSWAVIGTQDQAIPPAELTFMAQRAQSKITNVLAGHLSMITQPRVVADVIREAADATW